MASIEIFAVFCVFLAGVSAQVTPAPVYLTRCTRPHTGLSYEMIPLVNAGIHQGCTFFACDGDEQIRLHCSGSYPLGSNNAPLPDTYSQRIRGVLNVYHRYVAGPGGVLTPLLLELLVSNQRIPLRNSTLGEAASLIHYLVLDTLDATLVDPTVWDTMKNLKIVDLRVSTYDGIGPAFLKYASGVESLSINLRNAFVPRFYPEIIVNLPSLRCFNLAGTNFRCDCHLQAFIQKSPIWKFNDTYTNTLLSGDSWACASVKDAKCEKVGSEPQKGISQFVIHDCPSITLPSIPFLQGTEIFCDFSRLQVKLRNVGQTDNLEFLLGGSTAPECRGTINHGVVSFSALATQCGTNVTVTPGGGATGQPAKDLSLVNRIVMKKKTRTVVQARSDEKNLVIKPVSDKSLPVQCKILYKRADISQSFESTNNQLGMRYWDQQVRIQMERLPSSHIVGNFEFDITLTAVTDGNWTFFVRNCWATAGSDPNGEKGYLIENGCPVYDVSASLEEINPRRVRQRFSMPEFQLGEDPSAKVHIHCDVDPCDSKQTTCASLPFGTNCFETEPPVTEEASTQPLEETTKTSEELTENALAAENPTQGPVNTATSRSRMAVGFHPGRIFFNTRISNKAIKKIF